MKAFLRSPHPLLRDVGVFALSIGAFVYGWHQLQTGNIIYYNYRQQPVTPHLVMAAGLIIMLIHILDIVWWRKQRRQNPGPSEPRHTRRHHRHRQRNH